MDSVPLSDALWAATAIPAADWPPLQGRRTADVAVIGAGYTGLSAALHLAEAGSDVVVLEAGEPGVGASGRNGGQVIPGLKHDPDQLIGMFGPDKAEAWIRTSAATADLVFGLIERHGIDCQPVRAGWIQAGRSAAALPAMRRRCAQWARRGADVEWLDRPRLAEMLGTERYAGGWIDRRAGAVQPLSYVRGLARAAAGAGATIHARTPATGLARNDGRWRVETVQGVVEAEAVVLATNGYSGDLWPGLRQSVVPVYSVQVATAPLGENVRRTVLPGGQVISDTGRLTSYFRLDHTGRLLFGTGGATAAAGLPPLYRDLERRIGRLLPQLGAPQIAYRWGGRVALTGDHLPHLHELAPGLWAGLGYNGRGVGMATMMGRLIADRLVRGCPDPDWALPSQPLRPLPLHGLGNIAVGLARRWYALRDRLDG